MVLQDVGRRPSGKKIAADKAGVAVTDRSLISVDIQKRTKLTCKARLANEMIAGELPGNKGLVSAAGAKGWGFSV